MKGVFADNTSQILFLRQAQQHGSSALQHQQLSKSCEKQDYVVDDPSEDKFYSPGIKELAWNGVDKLKTGGFAIGQRFSFPMNVDSASILTVADNEFSDDAELVLSQKI